MLRTDPRRHLRLIVRNRKPVERPCRKKSSPQPRTGGTSTVWTPWLEKCGLSHGLCDLVCRLSHLERVDPVMIEAIRDVVAAELGDEYAPLERGDRARPAWGWRGRTTR